MIPPGAQVHFFETGHGDHLLAVDGSRVFDVPAGTAARFGVMDEPGQSAFLRSMGLDGTPFINDEPPQDMPVRSLSLAVAQKCNLACTYCYAAGGEFGGPARNMEWEVAQASVDRLVAEAEPGVRINLAFLGGEPLINRDLVRRTTDYAVERARANGLSVGFSITTNGTLLRPEDAVFFEEHGFAVTISLDGVGAVHDRLRPNRGGRGSFDAILKRVEPLLAAQHRMQVGARVTVTPQNMDLPETLDRFVAMGFHSIGFSPLLASPNGQHELDRNDLDEMLTQMIRCGGVFEAAVTEGRRYPFSNMAAAMQEIHRGTHRPYACGAGGGYFGVSAEGGLFACHRFVEDEAGAMGDVYDGPDLRRENWLADRHAHTQSPCKTCWARYLCGGGCHHEVIHRGRPACDYIRGWLHYCLQAYVRLSEVRPDYFGTPARAVSA
ncbi:radical SAM protein [Ruegeria sp. ANG-R]|uniref:radical SAM/SPASM domain-containing protein n=1 Tax=Ruegeria sp. ANG-R TaxID=1577903 RepID=UPI00057D7B4A|nr:radical SAM/SPASM domain-containing protein [Ruegeria sp. ANG-R]KIC41853.1 radical SAM protein [Ruegeria sp. ANG-R]